MDNKEFAKFLKNNKQKVDQAMVEFEKHSKSFDKKISEILSGL